LEAQAANGSANKFSRIKMEGYQTLDGRSRSLAIGKTSNPPARRSRASGVVAFFIAAETHYNSRARLLQFVCRTETDWQNSSEFLSRWSVVGSTIVQRQKRKTGRIFEAVKAERSQQESSYDGLTRGLQPAASPISGCRRSRRETRDGPAAMNGSPRSARAAGCRVPEAAGKLDSRP
jgi:hypothetical protein